LKRSNHGSSSPAATVNRLSAWNEDRFPATSAFYAEDVAVGTSIQKWNSNGGNGRATIGKVGIAVKMSEEMIKHSMYDIMAIHLREAGRPWLVTRAQGRQPTQLHRHNGIRQRCRFANDWYGRNGRGKRHVPARRLLTMVSTAINAGWQPNTIIMNPMAWIIFARDPVMRDFGFQNGRAMWQNVQGALVRLLSGRVSLSFVRGRSAIPTARDDIHADPESSVRDLQHHPVTVHRVQRSTLKTDIYVCDASEIGYMVVEEGVMTETWKDPAHELQKTKFREKYSVVGAIDPRVLVAKNISIAKSYDWYQRGSWQFGTGIPGLISH